MTEWSERLTKISVRFKEIDEVTGTFSSNVVLSNYKNNGKNPHRKRNPLAKVKH